MPQIRAGIIRDDTHMTSMKIVQFLKKPIPLSIYVQNTSICLTLDVQLGWLLYVIRSFLQIGFRFQYQLANLARLSLSSFYLADASLSVFSWFYTLVCAVVQKYYEMSFICNYLHFWYSFYNQPVIQNVTLPPNLPIPL